MAHRGEELLYSKYATTTQRFLRIDDEGISLGGYCRVESVETTDDGETFFNCVIVHDATADRSTAKTMLVLTASWPLVVISRCQIRSRACR